MIVVLLIWNIPRVIDLSLRQTSHIYKDEPNI